MYNTNDIVLSPLTLAMPGWGYLFGIIYTKCIHTNCHRGVNFGLKNAEIDFFWPKNAGNYAKKRNLPQNANYLPWEIVKTRKNTLAQKSVNPGNGIMGKTRNAEFPKSVLNLEIPGKTLKSVSLIILEIPKMQNMLFLLVNPKVWQLRKA